MLNSIPSVIQRVADKIPSIRRYLTGKALAMSFGLKTYEYYRTTITHMVSLVYQGFMGPEFMGILENLVKGQLSDAYERALADNGLSPEDATIEMRIELQGFIESEWTHIEPFYSDIIDALIDKTPLDPLLARAELWAGRWNDVYNAAEITINKQMGGKLVWRLGATEEHCQSCLQLNGIVAFAREWDESGVRPQNPPNSALTCGGWRCDCSLEPTDKRRSPNALSRILDIAVSGNV